MPMSPNASNLKVNTLNVNDKAPDFTLQDENGKETSLKALRGKVVVLYFYPRADTPDVPSRPVAFATLTSRFKKPVSSSWASRPTPPKHKRNFRRNSISHFLYSLMPTKKSPRPTALFRRKICMARK